MMVDPSTLPNSLIHQQVSNGVSVRMAVLFDLLAGESSATHLAQVAS
jgi:aspartate carbamoyltransferase catalytic subunit